MLGEYSPGVQGEIGLNKTYTRALALVLMVLASMVPATFATQNATPAATPLASPVAGPGLPAAVDWLVSQQQDDGSWLGMTGAPDAGTTVDAIIALAAAREAGLDVDAPIDSALSWLDSGEVAASYAETGTGQAAKLLLALVAAGADEVEIGGVDPLSLLDAGFDAETGLYGSGLYDHAYVLMALSAVDAEIPAKSIEFAGTVQAANGGFAWDGSTDETMVDSNTTSMVLQALVAAGEATDNPVVAGAAGYLRTTVTDQGAAYSVGGEADANSTALVAQALLAIGEDVTHLTTALTTFQNASGAYHWMHSDVADNAFSTIQVIPAAAGVSLPVIPGMMHMDKAA